MQEIFHLFVDGVADGALCGRTHDFFRNFVESGGELVDDFIHVIFDEFRHGLSGVLAEGGTDSVLGLHGDGQRERNPVSHDFVEVDFLGFFGEDFFQNLLLHDVFDVDFPKRREKERRDGGNRQQGD